MKGTRISTASVGAVCDCNAFGTLGDTLIRPTKNKQSTEDLFNT